MKPGKRLESPLAAETGNESSSRRVWLDPTIEELPRLTDLTLQTGDPIPGGGGTGGGGSTVF
jgi:hypothetical protein